MLRKLLFSDRAYPFMHQAMDGYALRQRTTAINVANVTTPGYRPLRVSFEEDLRHLLEGGRPAELEGRVTHPSHIHPPTYDPNSPLGLSLRAQEEAGPSNGVNEVDIDREMAELANNQILYQAMTQFMRRKVSMLRGAITGRSSG